MVKYWSKRMTECTAGRVERTHARSGEFLAPFSIRSSEHVGRGPKERSGFALA